MLLEPVSPETAVDISLQLDRDPPVLFANALEWRALHAWATPEGAPRLEQMFRFGFALDLADLRAELLALAPPEALQDLVTRLAAFLDGVTAASLTVVYPE